MAYEVITAAKDVVLAMAAIATVTIAVIGLRNWSRELRGKARFECARALAKATYRLRDQVRNFRAPFVSSHEFPAGYKGVFSGAAAQEDADAWAHVYKNRWGPVLDALEEFDTATLEAEVLFGAHIRSKTDELRECLKSLQASIQAVLDDKVASGQHFEKDRNFGKQMRAIVHASPSDDENDFSKRVRAAVRAIESEIRPHLRQPEKAVQKP